MSNNRTSQPNVFLRLWPLPKTRVDESLLESSRRKTFKVVPIAPAPLIARDSFWSDRKNRLGDFSGSESGKIALAISPPKHDNRKKFLTQKVQHIITWTFCAVQSEFTRYPKFGRAAQKKRAIHAFPN